MKKLNHSGFAVLEIILILVIVGILGFVGWYVYQARNKTNNTLDNTAQSQGEPQKSGKPKATTPQQTQTTTTNQAPYTTTYSKVPAEVQKAILAEYQKDVPSCVKNGQIVDYQGNPTDLRVDYAPGNSAFASIACGDGSGGLFAIKSDGTWEFLSRTQFEFTCELLTSHKIPNALLALNTGGDSSQVKCLDGSNNEQAYTAY